MSQKQDCPVWMPAPFFCIMIHVTMYLNGLFIFTRVSRLLSQTESIQEATLDSSYISFASTAASAAVSRGSTCSGIKAISSEFCQVSSPISPIVEMCAATVISTIYVIQLSSPLASRLAMCYPTCFNSAAKGVGRRVVANGRTLEGPSRGLHHARAARL